MTIRIAMWSGPRNLSTAMMRSFSSRSDTFVSDEPFYGCFLKDTGADHPLRDEVIAAMDCDWRSVMRSSLYFIFNSAALLPDTCRRSDSRNCAFAIKTIVR